MELYSSNVTYDGKSFNDNCLTICQYSLLTPIIEVLLSAIDLCGVDFGTCISPASSNLPDVIQAIVNQTCTCTVKVSSTDNCCGYLFSKFTSLDGTINIERNSTNHIYGTIVLAGGDDGTVIPTITGNTYNWLFTNGQLTYPEQFGIYIDNILHNFGTLNSTTALLVALNSLNLGTFIFANNVISVTNGGCETINLSANIPDINPKIVLSSNNVAVVKNSAAGNLQGATITPNTLANNGDSLLINFSLSSQSISGQARLFIGTSSNFLILPLLGGSNTYTGSYRVTRISSTSVILTGSFKAGLDFFGSATVNNEFISNGIGLGPFTVADLTVNPLPVQLTLNIPGVQTVTSNYLTIDKLSA